MARNQTLPEVHLRKKLRRYILRGHPWVFDKGVADTEGFAAGDLVSVVDEQGPMAVAFVDPKSPIRLRILDLHANAKVDGGWLQWRVRKAALRRSKDAGLATTNALRLVHGEADGIPGLVVDIYAGHAVVLLDGAAAQALWLPMLSHLKQGISSGGFTLKSISVRRVGRERKWIGEAPPRSTKIFEGDAVMEVDLLHGQKTGLFLDQRANRKLVGERSDGLNVLNLFSYTGGFSLAAALGGAKSTTSVDIAAPAIAAAKRNFQLSGLSVKRHEFVAADVFDFLRDAIKSRHTYDLVICDPPSFASSEKALKKGLRAYRSVNEMALRVVAPGGAFCSASCSSHVTDQHMLDVLADASRDAERDLVICDQRGAASDHPMRPGFPEGRYLSFFYCAVE